MEFIQQEVGQLIARFSSDLTRLVELAEKDEMTLQTMQSLTSEVKQYMSELELNMELEQNSHLIPHYIVLDTETTGLPTVYRSSNSSSGFIETPDAEHHLKAFDTARILQLSWAMYDVSGKIISIDNHLIKPEGYKVDSTFIHGITEEMANQGESFLEVIKMFYEDFNRVNFFVGHNINFDINVLKSELIRRNMHRVKGEFGKRKAICTMHIGKEIVRIPRKVGGFKFPKQSELYEKVLGEKMENAHDAKYDVLNLGKIVSRLIEIGEMHI